MFAKIITYFKNVFKSFTFKDWLLLILSIVVLSLYFWGKHWENKSIEYANQRGIYTDSLTIYKNKLNEEYAAKYTMIMNEKDLKLYNKELWNELKSLKDNPLVITKTNLETVVREIQAKNDTVYVHDNIETGLKDYTYNWSAKDSIWYSVKGISTVSGDFKTFNTTIPELKINSNLTLDLIETKQNLQVIAKTDNPYMNVSDIKSVVIDPRKSKILKSYFPQKKWGIGPQVGVGVTSDLKVRPYIGVGIQYSIFNF